MHPGGGQLQQWRGSPQHPQHGTGEASHQPQEAQSAQRCRAHNHLNNCDTGQHPEAPAARTWSESGVDGGDGIATNNSILRGDSNVSTVGRLANSEAMNRKLESIVAMPASMAMPEVPSGYFQPVPSN